MQQAVTILRPVVESPKPGQRTPAQKKPRPARKVRREPPLLLKVDSLERWLDLNA